MPQLLKIGPYTVYFWSNENDPLEPVHVHIAEGMFSFVGMLMVFLVLREDR